VKLDDNLSPSEFSEWKNSLLEVQTVHLLNRVVNPGDEGGVRYRILRGVTILIAGVGIVRRRDGGYSAAVLASNPDLAKGDGFVPTVDGEYDIGLSHIGE
jgi:hypothetical protein